jgi:hypothetical protein
MNYLMVDGEGDPNTSQTYANAVEVLYMVSYAIKFMVKKGTLAVDYGVMPLEGLWWADDMSSFSVADKGNWKWTMMILQPDFVSQETIESAISEIQARLASCDLNPGARENALKFYTLVRSLKKVQPSKNFTSLLTQAANSGVSTTKFT